MVVSPQHLDFLIKAYREVLKMKTWPSTLPAVQSSKFTIKKITTRVRDELACNLVQSSGFTSSDISQITTKLCITNEQRIILMDFWRTSLFRGRDTFIMPDLILYNAMSPHVVSFAKQPSISPISDDSTWECSISLYTLEQDYLSLIDLQSYLGIISTTYPSNLLPLPTFNYDIEPQEANICSDIGYSYEYRRARDHYDTTKLSIEWKMTLQQKIIFDAWCYHAISRGCAWFWIDGISIERGPELKQLRATGVITEELLDGGAYWKIYGIFETINYNYLPWSELEDMIKGVSYLSIINQPDDTFQAVGTTVVLEVVVAMVTGTPKYQWYFKGVAEIGAVLSTYSFQLTTAKIGDYYVVISDDAGQITSRLTSVDIITQPMMVLQPVLVSGYWEDVKLMTVSATGGHLSYQWQKSSDNVTFDSISGEILQRLEFTSLSPADDGYYRCVVTNGVGEAISNSVTVTCVVHPFTYEGEGLGGMGTYERYDQRTDYHQSCNFYIGITDTSDVYRDGVFAWAKGCTIQDANAQNSTTFYVGCYGASDCSYALKTAQFQTRLHYMSVRGVRIWAVATSRLT